MAGSKIEAGLYLSVWATAEAAVLTWIGSARTPLPHAERHLLRQRIAQLSRQHGNLSSVMSVVRDQVAEKAGYVGTKSFDPAIGLHGTADQLAQGLAALFQGANRLRWSDGGTIKLLRDIAAFGGNLQPHHPHIVHVSDDRGNGASLAVCWFCLPGRRVDAFD